jgi:hypothetical protein
MTQGKILIDLQEDGDQYSRVMNLPLELFAPKKNHRPVAGLRDEKYG